MKLLSGKEIKALSGFREIHEYDDRYINNLCSNYIFLYENYDNICQTESPETVLYSEYYWGALFIKAYQKKYNRNAGYEQMHFKLIERIEYTLGKVDIALLESIESEADKII